MGSRVTEGEQASPGKLLSTRLGSTTAWMSDGQDPSANDTGLPGGCLMMCVRGALGRGRVGYFRRPGRQLARAGADRPRSTVPVYRMHTDAEYGVNDHGLGRPSLQASAV